MSLLLIALIFITLALSMPHSNQKLGDNPLNSATTTIIHNTSPGALYWEGIALGDVSLPKHIDLAPAGSRRITSPERTIACFPLSVEFTDRDIPNGLIEFTDMLKSNGHFDRAKFVTGTVFYVECSCLRFQVESAFHHPDSWAVITDDILDGMEILFEVCALRHWAGKLFSENSKNQIIVSIQEAYQDADRCTPCRSDPWRWTKKYDSETGTFYDPEKGESPPNHLGKDNSTSTENSTSVFVA